MDRASEGRAAEIAELEVEYEAGLVRPSLCPGQWPAFVAAALYALAIINLWARPLAWGGRCFAQILYASAEPCRHVAVNSRVQS